MKTSTLPQSFKPYLWSYDFDGLDIEKNKQIVVLSILYNGDRSDWNKLFELYGENQIREIYKNSKKDLWNKKTINFWNLKFN